MSVRIFHPSVAPFVQQAARSIWEAGQLESFVTGVRYDPSSQLQKWAILASKLGRYDLKRQILRRAVSEVPLDKVVSWPWGELSRLLVGRFDRSGRATDWVWELAEKNFDRKVSKGLTHKLSGLYAFEYCSLSSIERARDLGIRIAYDMPAPEATFTQGILQKEYAAFPELITPWHRWTARRDGERTARRHSEYRGADVVIAASTFTQRSFASAGLDSSKVRVVPYGAPPPENREQALNGGSGPSQPLSLLWAGTFSVRKGAHYFLRAWDEGGFGRFARLRIYGTIALPDRFLQPLPPGIEICGAVPRAELMEQYRTSDALIFPTLCDGFGMVATEAWSRGLPVITTDCAGAADLLQNQRNGLLLAAGNSDRIIEALDWCLQNRRQLRNMREAALATAAGWQWSDYRQKLAATLEDAGLFGDRPQTGA